MRAQMTAKTSSARMPPITAKGTALWVSTTAPGSDKETEVWRLELEKTKNLIRRGEKSVKGSRKEAKEGKKVRGSFSTQEEGIKTKNCITYTRTA